MRRAQWSMLTLLVLWAPAGAASHPAPAVDVRTHSDTPLERRGRDQLLKLLQTYDLEQWLFTRDVVIQSRVIPHSHPVLTLNTQYVEDDVAQLATFLHEQLHWFMSEHVPGDRRRAADEALRKAFPEVPSTPPEGAANEGSTYLHLIVCYLELEALSTLIGGDAARAKLAAWNHYRWVYSTVLADTATIRDIVNRHIGPVRKRGPA
jgi:hypothetical protein